MQKHLMPCVHRSSWIICFAINNSPTISEYAPWLIRNDKVNGDHSSPHSPHTWWHQWEPCLMEKTDSRWLQASSQVFLRLFIKSVPYRRIYYLYLVSLTPFQKLISTLYMVRKEPHFLSLTPCMAKCIPVLKISERNASRTCAIVPCLPVRCFLKNVLKL